MAGSRKHSLLLYGHRGASAELPENTLPSFERAIELGVDVLELDVHLTADRHVVVSHDPSGERMAAVPKLIRDSTLAEVQSWDAGFGYCDRSGARPFADQGLRIPTFVEVLERFPEVPLNVDIKQPEPSMVGEVLELVRQHREEATVTLASWTGSTIREVRARGFSGPTVLARDEVTALLALPTTLHRWWPPRGHAVQVPPRYGPLDFSAPWFLNRCHALGLRVDFWTVNDAPTAERLLSRGADGLMTDDPAALRPALDRWKERASP